MTRHVAPERWADLAQGRIGDAEKRALESHSSTCAPCREARERVLGAVQAMTDVGKSPEPDLRWDLLSARVNWTIGSELRRREREAELRRGWARRLFFLALDRRFVLAFGVIGVIVVGVLASRKPQQMLSSAPQESVDPAIAPSVVPPGQPVVIEKKVRPMAMEGVVILSQGQVSLGGKPLSFDAAVRAGDVLSTGDGRVGVQFGGKDGFVLEPHSNLEILAFDDDAVELRVEGAVSVEATKRRPEQRLLVLAGARAVEVRGTIFRVAEHAGAIDVVVTRGRVAVVEEGNSVDVPAGSRIVLTMGQHVGSFLPREMNGPEASELAEVMRVPMMAGFTTAAGVREGSAVVKAMAPGKTRVRIDGVSWGVSWGVGGTMLRTDAGRHLVEMGGTSRWVQADVGEESEARISEEPERSERPDQLDAQLMLHGKAIESCGNRARKYDPDFPGELDVEVGINADGTVNSVAPVKGLADREIEACVLNVLRNDLTFPAGSKHVVVKKIRF